MRSEVGCRTTKDATSERQEMASAKSEAAPSEDKQKTKTLYIWGFDKSLSQDIVKEEFEKFAKVNRVTIIKDKATGDSKGFGYVECETPEDATKAMKEMDGKVLLGKNPVRIKYSFSDTPEWLKYLDSKGDLGERPRRGHPGGAGGRGRGRGYNNMMYGRDPRHEDSRRGSGRFGYGHDDYHHPHPYDRRDPEELDEFERRRPPSYDDPYYDERRPLAPPVPAYERRPPLDDPYDRRAYEDPYERRPMGVPRYERRPIDDPLDRDRRPIPRDDPYERLPPRDDIYDARPLPRTRDIYEDRRDLYRPSDRDIYREPISAREPLRSPELSSRLPPASMMDYRARSPVDRDPYYSAPLRKDEIRRGPAGNAPDYRTSYPMLREPAGRASYEGVPSKRVPLDPLPARVSDPYSDPYARVDPRL